MAAKKEEEADEIYGVRTFYRELGYYISSKEQYDRALKYFDIAVEKTPDDKRTLLGRSKTRAKAVQYPGALADVNHALENDPSDLRLLAQKAICTYLSCNFEQALIQNYSGYKRRIKPEDFRNGIMVCSEAIENCIGTRAGRPLRDYYKIIRKLAWKKARAALKPKVYKPQRKKRRKKKETNKDLKRIVEPLQKVKSIKLCVKHDSAEEKPRKVSLEPEPGIKIRESLTSQKSIEEPIPKGPPYPYKPVQDCTSNIDNLLAEKYLERLCLDKKFLAEILERPGLSSANKAGSKKVTKIARDAYKSVAQRQEVLRIRRPFYFIKYQEIVQGGGLRFKDKDKKNNTKIQEMTTRQADILMAQIKSHRERRNVKACLEACSKMKHFLDEKSRSVLPLKMEMYIELYDLVPKVILDLKRLNNNLLIFNQHKRILVAMGIPVEREPSQDSVIAYLKPQILDYKKLIYKTEQAVLTAKYSEEVSWLYYNLAAYNCEIKHYELAKVYANKCIFDARKSDNADWIINAKMVLVRINVQQMNRNEAKNQLNEALRIALRDENDKVADYITACLYIIENVDLTDTLGPKMLEEREQQLIEIMGKAGIKDAAAHLFRKMSVMPGHRRMSIMPGIRFDSDENIVEKQQQKTRKMSILPKPNDEDEPPAFLTKKKKSTRKQSTVGDDNEPQEDETK